MITRVLAEIDGITFTSICCYLIVLSQICSMTMTKHRFLYIFATTFRFFNKSLEEERLDRSKYGQYSSRFVPCCFVITVYFSLLHSTGSVFLFLVYVKQQRKSPVLLQVQIPNPVTLSPMKIRLPCI